MNAALTILFLASIGLTLASLGCTVYIAIKMYAEKGLIHALFGFFCCQIYPFIWGWIHASRLGIRDIMIFWSFIIVLSIVLQVVTQTVMTQEITNLMLDDINMQ